MQHQTHDSQHGMWRPRCQMRQASNRPVSMGSSRFMSEISYKRERDHGVVYPPEVTLWELHPYSKGEGEYSPTKEEDGDTCQGRCGVAGGGGHVWRCRVEY